MRVTLFVKLQFATTPKRLDKRTQKCNQMPHDDNIRIHIYGRSVHTCSVVVSECEARDRYVWLAERGVCVPDCAH